MEAFGKILGGMFYKGGVLAAGIASYLLYRSQYLPLYMGPVSYGVTSIGILGVLAYIYAMTNDDPEYEARMQEFYRLKPQLERALLEESFLAREWECYQCMRDGIDDLNSMRERLAEASSQLQVLPRTDDIEHKDECVQAEESVITEGNVAGVDTSNLQRTTKHSETSHDDTDDSGSDKSGIIHRRSSLDSNSTD